MQYLNKKIAILGFGLEANDLLNWLKHNSKNCSITIFDKNLKKDLTLPSGDYQYSLGPNYLKKDLTSFDLIFRSPGFYRLYPKLLQAEKAGAEILSATKLFFKLSKAKIIGVTGTKGKGTTISLIHQILKADHQQSYLAGNIGKPMLKLLPKLKPTDWVCLELSSFQLQDLTQSPHIALVLNITSEHLDVHQTTQEYRLAKSNILKFQKPTDHAVINQEYSATQKMAKLTQAQVHWFSKKNLSLDLSKVQLRGEHNLENISAAITAVKLAGVKDQSILKAVYSFKGLEHRLQLVGEINKVRLYNDSFSTTPETAIAAIKSFSEPTTIILGGSDKGSDFRKLGQEIVKAKHLKTIILIGQMAPQIKSAINQAGGFKGKFITNLSNMKQIVKRALQQSLPGEVVALSPACASFDMFDNYKDRGEQFKKAVNNLK